MIQVANNQNASSRLTAIPSQSLTGRYTACLQSVMCQLILYTDHTNCMVGAFIADGERLEVIGGAPSIYGEFYGVIRDHTGEILVVFRAAPQGRHLSLEIDMPGKGDLMRLANAERVMFLRAED